jgi:glycosyltransferase involved in cell wall biosynthesis
VYSSFDIYGWPQRNAPFEDLFQVCRDHPNITYHGTVSNTEIREALKKAHIFAYPSIWPETSCIAAIEAMSAGCAVVAPKFAALTETCGEYMVGYPMIEDPQRHAAIFASALLSTINEWHRNSDEFARHRLAPAKNYIDTYYNWDVRIEEWKALLKSLVKE